VLEELRLDELLADLPAVRWPDPVALEDELVAAVLLAEPRAAAQYLEVVRLVVEQAESLDDAVRHLYEAGAYCGGHGGPEVAGMLWDLAGALSQRRSQ
jgi:hypothetical protein